MNLSRTRRTLAVLVLLGATVAACGSDNDAPAPATTAPATTAPATTTPATTAPAGAASSTTSTGAPGPTGATTGSSTGAADGITMVVYDSFPTKDTTLNDALDAFTKSTGIHVTLAVAGDAGTMVAKAKLTAGNPEGDVMWGVDNTLLSEAVDGKVFTPYRAADVASIPAALTALVPGNEATPVDFGDVCVNYDVAYFTKHSLAVPTSLDDLAKPAYKDLLVVENPGTSSPGLAFLLATLAKFGDDGWQPYWRSLRTNGVKVEDSWTTAYYDDFSGAKGSTGDRPLVVSYGSSPPAEVLDADTPPAAAPTGVIASTCFRQVEFAGVLRGTKHEAEAHELIDFMLSNTFQAELPLNLYVYPARQGVALPDAFTKYAVVPTDPLTVAPADIEANRATWQDQWTQVVLR
ncbi:MAG: putative thiamine transporter thiamine-binding protein [Ilumatobacteraceae bacterium]|nr:putative thiamine transporter thiamine-binding protein [Ilumatobacteraceae bacterium]